MKKEYLIASVTIFILLALVSGGIYFFFFTKFFMKNADVSAPAPAPASTTPLSTALAISSKMSPKNLSYVIDNNSVKLINGLSEVSVVPSSSSKTVTKYFGDEVVGDFNGDGTMDTAFIITQSSGGSGTFYYVVTALQEGDTLIGSNAVLIGDSIAPQSLEFLDGMIIAHYAERKYDQEMTAIPSVAASAYMKVTGQTLERVPVVLTSSNKVTVGTSPFVLSGIAWGTWFGEGSFPYQLLDSDGSLLTEGEVKAQGEWMTSGYVAFSEEITFTKKPKGTVGLLVFKRDNPSGLPENDASTTIQVRFN